MNESSTTDTPLICVGQASIEIGRSIQSVSTSLGSRNGSNAGTLFVDNELHLEPCNHLLSASMGNNQWCSICDSNFSRCVDSVRRTFESCDHIRNVAVISDSCNQFSSWTSGIILDYINSDVSDVSVTAILMKPYMGNQGGIDSYFAVESAINALDFASSVIYRGYDDMASDSSPGVVADGTEGGFTRSNMSGRTYTLSEINHIIACDLWTGLVPGSNGLTHPAGNFLSSPLFEYLLSTSFFFFSVPILSLFRPLPFMAM
jgi:hypothetical protein